MKEDVLYLEADEEITAAIDRLVNLKAGRIKIVVPKRSNLLQSIVNLKLMKRAAEDAGKELILVTGDRTATHLAARVGIAVAETLKSEPKMPDAPEAEEAGDTVEAEEEPVEEISAEKAAAATAAMAAIPAPQTSKKPAFARPMMVRTPVAGDEPDEAVGGDAPSEGSSSPRVPNFAGLQKKTLFAGLAVGALILLFLLNWLLKSANITIYAKGAKINADFNFTVDPAAKSSDISKAVLAGTELRSAHDLSATATATGKKDVGTKAAGTITVTNYCYNPGTIPAGTTFTSGSGLKFVSTQAAVIPDKALQAGNCNNPPSVAVPVQASQNGDQYNLAPTTYSVGSFAQSDVKGSGNQMSGGTSKQVTVLTQGDVDKARDEAIAKDKDTAMKDLENKVKDDQRALMDSFTATPGSVTASPAVGEEASQAKVTIPMSYTLLVVDKSELEELTESQEQKQIGDQNQLYDNGLDKAVIKAGAKDQLGRWPYHLTTEASAGAKIDSKEIAKQVAGKKYGEAADIISRTAGVDHVEISLFPFWSTKLPQFTNRINIEIKVASKE